MSEDFYNENKRPEAEYRADYEVGYKKPPREHQWKPGQSGNPKGKRRKKHKPIKRSARGDLQNMLDETTIINVDGKPKEVTCQEIYFKKLREFAIKGNATAIRVLGDFIKGLPPDREKELTSALEMVLNHMEGKGGRLPTRENGDSSIEGWMDGFDPR